MAHAADGVVRHRAAQFFLCHVFVSHGFDHVGPGHEHIAGVGDHEREIGDGGRVHRTARARAHDGGDLRHHAAGQRVAQEDIGVTAERYDAFLNARAAGIVESDDRRAHFHGEVHHLADFVRIGFRQRTSEYCEILGEDVSEPAVDQAVACDQAVAGNHLGVHAEIAAAMLDQFVEFFEGTFVEKQFDAFTRGEFAFAMLAFAPFGAASFFRGGVAASKFFEAGHDLKDNIESLIVFGALFTAVVCLALGRILFRILEIRLNRAEHQLLAGVCGAALLSVLVFLLCALTLAWTPVFLVFGIVAIAGAVAVRVRIPAPPSGIPVLFGIPFVFYGAIYLANSLAPELSPDGSTYHLGLVARYFRMHGFERLTTNMYGNLSQGMEMLFLFAFAFGRHSAAATVHCIFLLTLPVLILLYARRIGHPGAGVCAAMMVFLSPLVGIDGVSAYNDVALATVAFALFYLLEIWREEKTDALLIPVGLLAGFCFAIKYTGFVAALYALIVLKRKIRLPAIAAACVALPWLLKNYLWLDNPVSPFLNRVFPNPYVHVSLEESYRHYLATYGLPSLKPLFWIVTVGGQLGGQIGPVFLLAPIALLGLRTRTGRQCLLAALIFLLPYPQNIGARFLIPALPFIALAIALTLEFSQILVAAVLLAAGILAWPRVIDRYRAPAGGWQITTVPWKAALGIIPADAWLSRNPGYRLAQSINRNVPANKRVWSDIAIAEAYTAPDILVYYYSAESEQIQDILLTGMNPELQPLWDWRFTFPARSLTRVRVLQNATSKDDIWSIGEARLFHGNEEVSPSHADAQPFPWTIGLALDHNPVTRWRSWESIRPGMYADFDFEAPVTLDRVDLFCSPDQSKIDLKLEGIDAHIERLEHQPVTDLRRLAAETIRSRGVDYLVIADDSAAGSDIAADASRWGLRLLASEGGAKLYRIQ